MRAAIVRPDGSIHSSMTQSEEAIERFTARRGLSWLAFVPDGAALTEEDFPTLDRTYRVEDGAFVRLVP